MEDDEDDQRLKF